MWIRRRTDNDDNCPYDYKPDQADFDGDGVGNACDNCPIHFNRGQSDGDGDGMWVGMVSFGQERFAAPSGTLLTTITFSALTQTTGTPLTILADSSGHPHPPHPTGYTKMLNLQSQNVLGAIGESAVITILPEPATLGLLSVAGLAVLGRRW